MQLWIAHKGKEYEQNIKKPTTDTAYNYNLRITGVNINLNCSSLQGSGEGGICVSVAACLSEHATPS